ncbi:helix-turn-helix domain-containing protein [Teredinibacter turnerae]|uniref:helix-turn-helix domain-containing protein n=1 Tax=Teredinibacter turnerae TaxID=2426 RepID=UPI00048A8B79|nr:helix-turn-helix transcriptional regulator [Teredinibacter turnerae]
MKKTIASPEYRKLVLWLKNKRIDQGLSMRALAAKLEVPHSFVQKIEMVERRLDVMEYISYCAALGIDPKDGLDAIN